MNIKSLITDIMSLSKTNLESNKLTNNQNVGTFILSSESLDGATREHAESTLNSIIAGIDDSITAAVASNNLSTEELTLRMNAASKIAGLAVNPNIARESLGKLKKVDSDKGAVVVNDNSSVDVVFQGELSTEAFDDQAINNAIYYSVAYNFAAARQDAFGEAFFPTIVVDPTQSGILVETEVISLMSEIERSIDGTPNKKGFNKKVITKAIYDGELLDNNRNKVVPVKVAGQNDAVFVSGHTFVDETSGTPVTTAPLKFGKEFNLLGISQTAAMLSKGTMDHTDTLDRTINLDKLYITIKGENSAGDPVTEMIEVPVNIFPHSNFTYSTQDHWKDMNLNFSTSSIIINGSNVKTVDGNESEIFKALPSFANHKFHVEVQVSGKANVEYADMELFANKIKLVEVRNPSGNLVLETSPEYADFKTIFDTLELSGFTLEAYRTNSNLRTNGQLVTNDKFQQIYNVPLRTGFSVFLPATNANGKELSADSLATLISYSGIKVNLAAVRKLTEFASTLKIVTNNGSNKEIELDTIGRHHVYPYYNEITFGLSKHVDSLRSNDREEDIRAAFITNIKNEAIKMGIESNYNVVYDIMRGNLGGKKTIIVGTDPRIEQYLTKDGNNKIEISSTLDAIVVSSNNPALKGSMYVTYSIFDDQRNTAVNPLSFGAHLWRPTIATDIVVTQGGSTRRAINTVPSFLHIVSLPIVSKFNVSDIDEVLGKVTVNSKSI